MLLKEANLARWGSSPAILAKPEVSFLFRRFKDLKRACQGIIHTHHRTCVVKLSTVVWSREYRN